MRAHDVQAEGTMKAENIYDNDSLKRPVNLTANTRSNIGGIREN